MKEIGSIKCATEEYTAIMVRGELMLDCRTQGNPNSDIFVVPAPALQWLHGVSQLALKHPTTHVLAMTADEAEKLRTALRYCVLIEAGQFAVACDHLISRITALGDAI